MGVGKAPTRVVFADVFYSFPGSIRADVGSREHVADGQWVNYQLWQRLGRERWTMVKDHVNRGGAMD